MSSLTASVCDAYVAGWLALYGIVVYSRIFDLPRRGWAERGTNELAPLVPAAVVTETVILGLDDWIVLPNTIAMIAWLLWAFSSDNDGRWRRRAQRATGAVRRRFARLVVAHDAT